jgi:hypothetical protein
VALQQSAVLDCGNGNLGALNRDWEIALMRFSAPHFVEEKLAATCSPGQI